MAGIKQLYKIQCLNGIEETDLLLQLDKKEITIAVTKQENIDIDNTAQIKVVTEDISEEQYKWEIEDTNIATIDSKGNITALAGGTTTIKCKSIDGTKTYATSNLIVEERTYLYYYGNQCESITGGYATSARTGRRFYPTFNEDNVYIDCYAGWGGGGIRPANAIDLTNYKYLKSYGQLTSYATNDSDGRILATSKSDTWGSSYMPSDYSSGNTTGRSNGNQTLINDISNLEGEYYIWNGFNQSHGYIYEVYLVK